jgi:DNA-binding transcriptional LysR family regulator
MSVHQSASRESICLVSGTISLDSIAVFARVAEDASFRGAATELGIPPSTVSRKVAELESQLGVRLLRRTTRRVALTDAGRAYLSACQAPLGALAEAGRAVRDAGVEARGRLRVTASVTFGERYLGPMLDVYMRDHPRVEVEVLLTDRYVDLVEEGFDVAFRAGGVGDPSLVARALGSGVLRCVASPAYLAGRPTPRKPQDLAEHACVVYPPLAPSGRWTFRSRGRAVHVPARGRLVVHSLPLAFEAACRGMGITRVPEPLAHDALAAGELVELLGAFRPLPSPFLLVYPSGARVTPRLRAFIEIATAAELPGAARPRQTR